MKKKLIILILAAILIVSAVFTAGCGSKSAAANPSKQSGSNQTQSAANQNTSKSSKSAEKKNGPETVTKLLDFKLQDINGKEISTSDLKGKKIMLSFMTTKDMPCELQMPGMQEVQKQLKSTDFVIIAVIRGEDAKTVKTYMDKAKYSFTVLLDNDSKVTDLYKVEGVPTTFFINAMGNVAKVHVGSMQKFTIDKYMDMLVD